MYKPIVATAAPIESDIETEVIELWQSSYRTNSIDSPFKTWRVKRNKGTNKLKQPIVFPVDYNWQLRWRKRNKIYFEDSIKYFRDDNIDFGNFLIIRELKKH